MGRKKKDNTVVVSVRMPTYLYEFLKSQASKRSMTTNAAIVSYLEVATCALEKKEMLNFYNRWLEEEYKNKLKQKLEKATLPQRKEN